MKKLYMTFIVGFLCAGISSAYAETGKEHYGVIDAVYQSKSSVVVSDIYMQMALNLKVYDQRGDKINRYGLKVGQKVEYKLSFEDESEVVEIRVKPSSFKIPDSADDD